MLGRASANCAIVMFVTVTSLASAGFASLGSFEVEAGAGPSFHVVRFAGSALLSFGFTAMSVYAVIGRSSMWVVSLKRSTSGAFSIRRMASLSGGASGV